MKALEVIARTFGQKRLRFANSTRPQDSWQLAVSLTLGADSCGPSEKETKEEKKTCPII